jgi:hypothetical protein
MIINIIIIIIIIENDIIHRAIIFLDVNCNAAIKIKPLDTKALNKQIDELKKQLEQVQKIGQPQ